ncbi:hypothetical protein AB0F93_00350 [Micromonospora tulbaghiae]|uniref:hypothetical protein n=1 Tax=Micromonospora tulbaghiae TaxID=479978 RepID=UPI0033222B64
MTAENERAGSRPKAPTIPLYDYDEAAAARQLFGHQLPNPLWEQANIVAPHLRSGETVDAAAARPSPLMLNVPESLRDILQALHEHRRDHVIRFGERPQAMVLVGQRLWAKLRREATGDVNDPVYYRVDPVEDEMLLAPYNARIVPADVPNDEWRLVVPTEWRGTVAN